jgi:hypothetical protein
MGEGAEPEKSPEKKLFTSELRPSSPRSGLCSAAPPARARPRHHGQNRVAARSSWRRSFWSTTSSVNVT